MLHIHSLNELSLEKTWLTIGVFDGVHRGHQDIIRTLTKDAQENQASSLVISFYPHPAAILGKRTDLKYLSPPEEKAELLEKLGVDYLLSYPFSKKVAAHSAEKFMGEIQKHIHLEKMFIGYDFSLGKNRQGDAEYLTNLGRKTGYIVQKFSPLLSNDLAISSSRVRDALLTGRVRDAQNLLGRPYSLRGSVVHGDGRGRKINIPTANIEVNPEKAVPLKGVYACWATARGQRYPALTNIGIRPTFTPDKVEANIETHILKFDKDLYGEVLKLEFISRLRDEVKFNSVDALLMQISRDIEKAKEILK